MTARLGLLLEKKRDAVLGPSKISTAESRGEREYQASLGYCCCWVEACRSWFVLDALRCERGGILHVKQREHVEKTQNLACGTSADKLEADICQYLRSFLLSTGRQAHSCAMLARPG